MTDNKPEIEDIHDQREWIPERCDVYDYLIAGFCGVFAGVIDVLLVKSPVDNMATSIMGKQADRTADGLVIRTSQLLWRTDRRTVGKSRKMPTTLEQCISYLEQAFPVNYDARYAKDLAVEEGMLRGMRPVNHHLLSLAHCTDGIGLLFSIIDQFSGKATFLDSGKLIHVVPMKTSLSIPYLQGSNTISRVFCGFVNWIGHLLSDLCGSSSIRANRAGKSGRGSGIPIPFYELFLGCNFQGMSGEQFSNTMIQVFEEGYDFRFGMAAAVPVLIEELMIKTFWTLRQKCVRGKSWKESLPSSKHADLRKMLLVGNASFLLLDGADAAVHGVKDGTPVSFFCHLNLIGWGRFVILVMRELTIQFGPAVKNDIKYFCSEITIALNLNEQQELKAFYERMEREKQDTEILFQKYMRQVEEEYAVLFAEVQATFDGGQSASYRAEHSVKLAEKSGVSEDKIIRNMQELDDLFL